jgi:hypothetical protein
MKTTWQYDDCPAPLALTFLATAQNPPDRGAGCRRRPLSTSNRPSRASAPTCRQLVGLYPHCVRSHEDRGSRLNAIRTVNLKAFEVAAALDAQRQSSGRMGSLHF